MTEEELKAKEEELLRREEELKAKEESLNEREGKLAAREADAGSIAQTIKEEYEKKLAAQQAEFEERLRQREEVIRQLAADGGNQPNDDESPFNKMNSRRLAQKAA